MTLPLPAAFLPNLHAGSALARPIGRYVQVVASLGVPADADIPCASDPLVHRDVAATAGLASPHSAGRRQRVLRREPVAMFAVGLRLVHRIVRAMRHLDKMARVHASFVGASVVEIGSGFHRAVRELVGKDVCSAGTAIEAKQAVAVSVETGRPLPTFILATTFNLVPEPIHRRVSSLVATLASSITRLADVHA